MGIGYQFIDIFQTFLRFGKNDDMISRFAFVIDRPILVSAVCIIENISLHAVNNLDFSSLFRLFFCFCRTVRECLHNTMICNSDCRMAPFCCLCYDVLWLVKTVPFGSSWSGYEVPHVCHLRMYLLVPKQHPSFPDL